MRWYDDLYLGEKIAKKKNKIIYKIKDRKFLPNTYVIILPRNDRNTLETIPAEILKQKYYRKVEIVIVGLAKGKEEAYKVMQEIIDDCYEQTGDVNVKEFIINQMPILV
ncbi:MAG: hypothetical protein K6E58_06530 [Eubacterium sp.]|nr:hypothetical protein [Eubacterium sp.]